MKKLRVKNMIIVLLVAIVMMAVSTEVFATELVNPINILTNSETTLDTNTQVNIETNTVTPTTNTVAPITNTVETGTANTLPQTGDASDYAIFLLIALCVVVSIYAYKKVRDYNRI